jgi:hypothetical protein
MGKRARREVREAVQQQRQQRIEVSVMQKYVLTNPRNSMNALGWNRLSPQRGDHGWFRRGEERSELIIYKFFDGEDSLAFAWGFDLARKQLPRSFAAAVAGDFEGSLFASVLLRGFDAFSRPPKIERRRLDFETEAQ